MAPRTSLAGPLGAVVIEDGESGVREVSLTRKRSAGGARSRLAASLRRYFAGEAVDFSDFDVDWSDYTDFERAVLRETMRIPRGETRTYGQIADAIGRPGAARAVGQALGKNRTCIVVPCHRVVATNGIGGFGAGLAWKRALLALEGGNR